MFMSSDISFEQIKSAYNKVIQSALKNASPFIHPKNGEVVSNVFKTNNNDGGLQLAGASIPNPDSEIDKTV
jgi:hypothetical protein